MGVDLGSETANASAQQQSAARGQLLEQLRALPGVPMASASVITPIGTTAWDQDIKAVGFAQASPTDADMWVNEVSDGYFSTTGTSLITGRDFDARDVAASAKVAIVNQAMTQRVFGARSAIGQSVQILDGTDYGPRIEIVGMVANAKYGSMSETAHPIIYLSMAQDSEAVPAANFEIRTVGPTAAIIPSIKTAVALVAPHASLDFTTLEGQVAESLRLPRTLATLSGFFGALALLLAMIGMYGIMSYNVARRKNEIGVRNALRATQSRVVRMVMG